MKKYLFIVVLMVTAQLSWATPYYLRINGKTDIVTTFFGTDYQGRDQYMASSVPLEKGDVLTCYDAGSKAEWAIKALDSYSVSGFTASAAGITCSVGGCYDVYMKFAYEDDLVYIGKGSGCIQDTTIHSDTTIVDPIDTIKEPQEDKYKQLDYGTSVPAQCPDVLLQSFYWDSNSSTAKHGDTKWATLLAQASEIGAYFDMVWLPPSAKSSGGVGYLPSQYSNQTSAWGSRAELEKLIEALHASNTKVIADIVINHVNNKSSWCDFYSLDFGSYGQFNPTPAWICATDEMNNEANKKAAGSCYGKATGADDGGYLGEDNYTAARDWAHTNSDVQAMCKAYLRWMKYVIGYDGWRYDYCKGFKGKYINMYNAAAKNYFSVTEFWDGNVNTLQSYLNDVNWNTLTFDFATKYEALNRGIAAGNYQGCKGSGLLGVGKSRYAVTFVDSHDSYTRDDNEICGKNKSMSNKSVVLQANAFILSMPGVPCVFYPHWKTWKSEISAMISARHMTGVHSESSVSDEAGNGYYKATITGKNGSIRLLLGPNSGYATCPSGYTKAVSGTDFGVYYKVDKPVLPKLVITPGNTVFKKSSLTVVMKTIEGTEKATVYYTLDGSNPRTSETRLEYTAPFTIKETTTLKAYAECASGSTPTQTYTYTYKEPQTSPITVRFYKPASWTKVYLYSWSLDGKTQYNGKWPGKELTEPENGWYAFTFDAEVKEVNFIFNAGSGKDQTSDLYTDEDACYSWQNGAEKYEPNCIYTALPEVYDDSEISLDATQPMYNVLGQPVDIHYKGVIIQNGHKFICY